MFRLFLLGIGFILFSIASYSQSNDLDLLPCATEPHLSEQLLYYQQNLNNYRFLSDDTLYIPIKVHIVGTDEGTGYASETLVRNAFCGLNESFRQVKVQFYLVGEFNYIDNSGWYEHQEFAPGRNMIATNNFPGVLNSYVVRTAAGACGYYSGGVDGVVLAIHCIGPNSQTWAHELGHQLTLPHTFFGWEGTTYNPSEPTPDRLWFRNAWRQVERWDGENCRHAGDGFCDTPPDYLSFRWGCSASNPLGILIADPLGIQGNVDGTNIMSYASDICMSRFSEEQIQAMRMNLLLDRSEIVSFDNEFGTITTGVEILQPQANSDVQYDDAIVQWNKVNGATHYHVQISPLPLFSNLIFNDIVSDTFLLLNNLIPDRTHFLRIKPLSPINFCEGFSERVSFFATQLSGIRFQGSNSFNIDFQNIIRANQPIELTFSGDVAKNLKLSLVHSNGQIIREEQGRFYSGQNHLITTDNFPAGMYLLIAESESGEIQTRKLIVQ